MHIDHSVTISYGDRHYSVALPVVPHREHIEFTILAMMQRALGAFHGSTGQAATHAELRNKLYTLASQRPDLVPELIERGII